MLFLWINTLNFLPKNKDTFLILSFFSLLYFYGVENKKKMNLFFIIVTQQAIKNCIENFCHFFKTSLEKWNYANVSNHSRV